MIRKQSTRALSLLLALLFVVTLLPQRALGAAVSAETVEAAQIYSANAATDSALYAKVLEAPKDAPTYRDGVYRGTGQGHHSMITVEVIIENGKIAKAEVLEQNETPSYWSGAVEILQDFIGLSSEEEVGAVDTVSGATMSSAAIRYAIREALLSAEDAGIFASGQGTYQRPYLIETVQQLQDFAAAVDGGNTFEGEYIQLNANLDLSAVADWNPIGTEGKSSDGENQKASFYGDFNGAGHTISGLRIDHVYTGKMKSEANIGLFSFLGKTARVHDLTMENVSIHAATASASDGITIRAGAIAGDTGRYSGAGRTAIVDSCIVSGEIIVDGAKGQCFAGGVMGRIFTYGAVLNCYSSADVKVTTDGSFNAAYAGGIVGFTGNETILWNSAASGSVTASNKTSSMNFGDSYAGGICGATGFWSVNNYSTGNATIERLKPGDNAGTNVGMITGQATGGMMGDFNYYSQQGVLMIVNADGTTQKVPTLGWQPENQLVTEGEILHSNQSKTDAAAIRPAVGMSAANMASASFADTLNANLPALDRTLRRDGEQEYGIAVRTWKLVDGVVLPVGDYYVNTTPDASIFASGTGTETDPFIIRTEAQLEAFAHSLTPGIDYAGYHIRLDADLDISGKDWDPIGVNVNDATKYGFINFNGEFDGNYHSISGLAEGSESARRELAFGSSRIGLFGILGAEASVHDLELRDVKIYTHCDRSAFVGGLAGQIEGSETEGDFRGAVVDQVSVTGVIDHVGGTGNAFVGGVAGWQFKSAIINSWTDTDLRCVINATPAHGGDLAEVGGIVGITNRGLVANCYSLGDEYGSGLRVEDQEIEGMACVSAIAGVNGGNIVNCYGEGNVTAAEWCIYAGMATGWATGISKTYYIWYNEEAVMTVNGGEVIAPPETIGEKTGGGNSDEWGFAFDGAFADWMNPYKVSNPNWGKTVSNGLNQTFSAFPIDIQTIYGLRDDALRQWTVDSTGRAVLGGDRAKITYVQPEAETVKPAEKALQDGTWYGRSIDAGKTCTVKITVADGKVTSVEVLSGPTSGEYYEQAIERAKFKSTYGDRSDYAPADPSRFGGGSGTAADPYLISTEAQLRYLADSINEDVSWAGKYFRQTADITLHGEWKPIGLAIHTEIQGSQEWVALNPFSGVYDGGDHVVRGLKMGTAEAPVDTCVGAMFALVVGGYDSNLIPGADEPEKNWTAQLKNIHLEDVDIHTTNYYRSYAAGLLGLGQNGFVIDSCSATGTASAHTQKDNISYAAGLFASGLRGLVMNSWADVKVRATTEDAYSYAGGLAPITNRVTVVNCYALGDVYATAGNANKTVAGGFIGCDGGVCFNCYADNTVTCGKYSGDVGGFVGLQGSVSAERYCYYNTERTITNGDKTMPNSYVGYQANGATNRQDDGGKTAKDIASKAFAELLSDNRAKYPAVFTELRDELGADETGSSGFHSVYYHGDGSDLKPWISDGAHAVFEMKQTPVEPTAQPCDGGAQCPSNVFTDVDRSAKSWYHLPVDWAVTNGVTNGTSASTFSPNQACTRGQVVTFLWRTAGEPEPKSSVNPFKDVKIDAYYYKAVLWAVEQEITKGMTATTFSPDATCTRGQVVTFLWRYEHSPKVRAANPFADVPAGTWYTDAVLWAVERGVTTGTSATTFAPNSPCTRAHVVTFLYRDVTAE